MATARSTTTSARNEIIQMLEDDHKRAKKAFKDFEKLDPESDAEECEAIVRQTCAELTVHARLEEECFYPAVRGALEEADLVDEAEVEHQSAKDLIAKLEGMSPGDDKFAATFTVLGEYIQHHVKEEEGEMFPQASKSKSIDWESLASEMTSRRAELMEELMPEQAADLDDEDADAQQGTTRASTASRSGSGASRSSASGARPQAKKSSDDKR